MQTVLQIFYPVVHHKVSYTINILRPNVQGLVQALQSYEEISYPYPYFLSICRMWVSLNKRLVCTLYPNFFLLT